MTLVVNAAESLFVDQESNHGNLRCFQALVAQFLVEGDIGIPLIVEITSVIGNRPKISDLNHIIMRTAKERFPRQ
jgi:hypothetical protein